MTATITPCIHVRIKDDDELVSDFYRFILDSFDEGNGPPIMGPRGGSSGLGNFTGWFWTEHTERIEAFFTERKALS